jgi:hypothetical protein
MKNRLIVKSSLEQMCGHHSPGGTQKNLLGRGRGEGDGKRAGEKRSGRGAARDPGSAASMVTLAFSSLLLLIVSTSGAAMPSLLTHRGMDTRALVPRGGRLKFLSLRICAHMHSTLPRACKRGAAPLELRGGGDRRHEIEGDDAMVLENDMAAHKFHQEEELEEEEETDEEWRFTAGEVEGVAEPCVLHEETEEIAYGQGLRDAGGGGGGGGGDREGERARVRASEGGLVRERGEDLGGGGGGWGGKEGGGHDSDFSSGSLLLRCLIIYI